MDRLAAPGTLQSSPAGFSGRTAILELPAAPSSRQTCTRHGSRSLQVQCQIPNGQQNARCRPAGPRQDSVQARAMAVTWDTYWPEPEEAFREQADASGGADSRPGFFAPNTPTVPARPLKINRDLLLVSSPSWVPCCACCLPRAPHRTAALMHGTVGSATQPREASQPSNNSTLAVPLLVTLRVKSSPVSLCIMVPTCSCSC